MDFGLKEPSKERPVTGWDRRQVRFARGIVLNTPDVDRRTFYVRRTLQILVFIFFLFIAFFAVSLHWALIIPVSFVGMFVVGTEYFNGYGPSQRDLAWARAVLSETEATAGDPESASRVLFVTDESEVGVYTNWDDLTIDLEPEHSDSSDGSRVFDDDGQEYSVIVDGLDVWYELDPSSPDNSKFLFDAVTSRGSIDDAEDLADAIDKFVEKFGFDVI